MEGDVVKRFEKGFEAGVKSVDDTIKVRVAYAGSFADAAKGKTIAAAQYAEGADVIYHAAGGTGRVSLAKLSLSTKNVKKKIRFGLLVLTVTKVKMENTLQKMASQLILF